MEDLKGAMDALFRAIQFAEQEAIRDVLDKGIDAHHEDPPPPMTCSTCGKKLAVRGQIGMLLYECCQCIPKGFTMADDHRYVSGECRDQEE